MISASRIPSLTMLTTVATGIRSAQAGNSAHLVRINGDEGKGLHRILPSMPSIAQVLTNPWAEDAAMSMKG